MYPIGKSQYTYLENIEYITNAINHFIFSNNDSSTNPPK